MHFIYNVLYIHIKNTYDIYPHNASKGHRNYICMRTYIMQIGFMKTTE